MVRHRLHVLGPTSSYYLSPINSYETTVITLRKYTTSILEGRIRCQTDHELVDVPGARSGVDSQLLQVPVEKKSIEIRIRHIQIREV